MVWIEAEQPYGYVPYQTTANDALEERENELFSPTGLTIGFSILSAAFVVISLLIIRCNWNCREFYEWNAIRLGMPGLCVFLSILNGTMAYDYERTKFSSLWNIPIYMMLSTIAPGIYVFTFVMTFLAYRTRSMPFFFVHRGPGRNETGESRIDEDDEVYQPLVRPAILVVFTRIFAFGLIILSLIVDLNVFSDNSQVGRTGWASVVNNPEGSPTLSIILSLLPMTVVSLLCLYFACLLCRYGNEFSMVIPTSSINAWLCPVVGALAMIVGQMFGPDLYLITSNSGILCYMMGITRALYLIRHDIREAGELGYFLNALEIAHKREDQLAPSARMIRNGSESGSTTFDATGSKEDEELGAAAAAPPQIQTRVPEQV
mmetsp:Transcript_9205/g.19953  ORF Transcript_9205/g.19953 Transcript_9205/m.19953 type:complete len:375 (+) Transcript_9205:190-1314(+)|eukprot:CAMPEP_0168180904 /NCGR_PEP_ID=MMETSP0139_2-20121125/10850_1 /TAXON_ID=44445 /ORGANISM="Pseudo-nitzschia australis, Strain 10249 10 AB" /LENGTH=374 /DNA_ID=CAMNT_0008101281 /DNA_START=158 /DNA_END=1282 /DNA_ORIENTATION=-